MTYSSRQIAWTTFALAVILLTVIGISSYRATNKLVASEQLVSHTHEVQAVLEDVRSDVMEAAYARRGFIITSNEEELYGYDAGIRDLPSKLDHLRALTKDNAAQGQRFQTLQSLIDQDLALLAQSINLRLSGRSDHAQQVNFTKLGTILTHQTGALIQEMAEQEAQLLEQRIAQSVRQYRHTVTVLTTAFVLAIFLLYLNFYRLNLELKERERAEHAAREGEQLINAFFSSSTVGFAIIDSDLRYERMNHVFSEIAGVQPQALIGNTIGEAPARSLQQTESCVQEVIAHHQPVLDRTISAALPGKPSELRYWTVNCFPIADASGVINKVGITTLDVTDRKNAEAASLKLSSRLLRLQDEERRRIARELHDSLGQYLTALKINLEIAPGLQEPRRSELLAEATRLADTCLTETRTISHLLHPPLLDEAGFASAANWYVQGFAERSKISVNIDLPPDLERLPRPVETALFRVLQESLTNIHRHARSQAADIHLRLSDRSVRLVVQDYGQGIPRELLNKWQRDGAQGGVGLAGMRERLRELGGHLDIASGQQGTILTAEVPLPDDGSLRSPGEGVPAA